MKPTWIVCVKQVPREPVFKRTRDSLQIDRDRTEGILNPRDTLALRTARDLREHAGGRIVAVTMGPPQAEEALREAIACGADEGVLLSDAAFAGADTLATAHTLAAAIRRIGDFALVLCGAQTLDSDTGQVGPQLAEILDLPMAAYVVKVSYARAAFQVERRLDGFRERLRMRAPALVTVAACARTCEPLSLGAVEAAFRAPKVVRWRKRDLDVDAGCIGWKGSATRADSYGHSKRQRSGEVIRERPAAAVDRILRVLVERGILGD